MHRSKPPNGPKALFQAIRLISPAMHILDIKTLPYRAQASRIVNGYQKIENPYCLYSVESTKTSSKALSFISVSRNSFSGSEPSTMPAPA